MSKQLSKRCVSRRQRQRNGCCMKLGCTGTRASGLGFDCGPQPFPDTPTTPSSISHPMRSNFLRSLRSPTGPTVLRPELQPDDVKSNLTDLSLSNIG